MSKSDEKAAGAKSPAGLEGVVAAESSIGDVDGINGVLIYQGLNIHDLAEHATFEEVVYLLWHGRLPKREELEALRRELAAEMTLPAEVVELIRRFPRDAEPMDSLRTAVSALAFYDAGARDLSREGALRTATRLTAQFPVVVAGTLADMYGAVTGAIAALSGPLHGGANTNVMKMLLDIEDPARAEEWLRDALAKKKKIMGFGHRVYKTEDPRSVWLRKFSKEMGEAKGETRWNEILERLREVMFRDKKLYPNVDYYSGSAYYLMGIPLDLFTPIFAVSRISGWTGHVLEQYANNRLIRPRAEYIGPRGVPYMPIGER